MPASYMSSEVYSSEPTKGSKNTEQRIIYKSELHLWEKKKSLRYGNPSYLLDKTFVFDIYKFVVEKRR